MSEIPLRLRGVAETLLIPLASRVDASRKRDGLLQDPVAEDFADRLQVDLGRYRREWAQRETVIGRTTILDAQTRSFLAQHPDATVINLGAGLCTRFFRVDNQRVRWIDLDLPEVIDLKSQLVEVGERYSLVQASVTDPEFLDSLGEVRSPTLFLAEGLLMYLPDDEVRALLNRIAGAFPGSHVLLEGFSPFLLRTMGRRSPTIQATGATFKWGLGHPKDLERLVPGARVRGVWHHPEAHPERWRWMRPLRFIGPIHRSMKIVHLECPGPSPGRS